MGSNLVLELGIIYFNEKKMNQFKIIAINIILSTFILSQGTIKIYNKEDGLISQNISHIYNDSDGNIWCSASSVRKGIMKFDGENWTNYFNKKDMKTIILVTAFFEDSKGIIWIGSRSAEYIMANGIWKMDGSKYKRLSKVGTNYIDEDTKGNIWFGGKNIGYFNGNDVVEFSKKQIGAKKITALHCDLDGLVWIGTKNGVLYYDGSGWIKVGDSANSPQSQVNSIITDNENNLWFGAENGVFKYNGDIWQHYTTDNGLVTDGTLLLRIDKNNNIYAIAGKAGKEETGFGIIDISNAIGQSLANTGLSIYKDNIWQGFADSEGTPNDINPIFFEDRRGNLWFNSNSNSIYKFDGNKWTMHNETNGCRIERFGIMTEDSKGNYWFASNGSTKGIAKFDGDTWLYFNKDNGLPSNIITSIVEGNDGSIWLGTFKGATQIVY